MKTVKEQWKEHKWTMISVWVVCGLYILFIITSKSGGGIPEKVDVIELHCSEFSGSYSGTSQMGRSSGTAEITINSDCSATLRYDHGSLGAATEYGVIADNGAKFDKSSGGTYDLSMSGNQVVLEGTSWRCVMTRGLSGNSSSPQSQVKDYVNCDNCRKKMYDGQDAVTLRTNPDKLFCSQYCADYWFASH